MLRRTFKAFQYHDFRLLWFGACTSSIGTWMQEVAQNWLVLEITKSPFLLGLDDFLGDIPIFLFSLVGGVVADRMDRRKLLMISQVIQMPSALTLAVLICDSQDSGLAYPPLLLRRWNRAGVRRPGLFRAGAEPGREGGISRMPSR